MPTKSNSAAQPALIVFGINQPVGCPQAAWFRAAHVKRVYATAQRIGFSSIAVDSEERRAFAAKLEEGQLLAGRKLLLPAITDELYQQLSNLIADKATAAEDRAPKEQEPESTPKADAETGPHPPSEPEPSAEAPAATTVTAAAWSTLTPGTRVLALYLDKRGNPEGWWEAEVVHIREGVFFLTWCDEPEAGVVMRHRDQIALMLPTT